MAPGSRYLPARSISRSAAGKNLSLPTAAILPSTIAAPPSMVPPGVTTRPFLKTISAVLTAIFVIHLLVDLLFRLSQVTQVDHAIDRWRWLWQAEVFPVLGNLTRTLHIDTAVARNRLLGFHIECVGFFRFVLVRLGAVGEGAHGRFFVFRVIEKYAGFQVGAQKAHHEGAFLLRPVAPGTGDRVLEVVDVVGGEAER